MIREIIDDCWESSEVLESLVRMTFSNILIATM
jgi:hypothetical protein